MSAPAEQTMSNLPAAAEPRAKRNPVPAWLFISLLLLLYWGMVYFDQRSGWLNESVYAPYRSIKELAEMQPVSEDGGVLLQGKDLFSRNCAVCHMETGIGNPANGCPPLVGSEWVAAAGPNRLVRLVSFGSGGPIEVAGKTYDPPSPMLPIGNALPGDEKQKAESIAAIISYIRKTFGNNASLVTPEQVAKVREQIKDHSGPFSAKELLGVPEK